MSPVLVPVAATSAAHVSPAPTSTAGATTSLAALLRDIHPGPALLPTATDPRIQGWLWLFAIVCAVLLLGAALSAYWRDRRWTRQIDWAAPSLVPQLQSVLRQAALARWPEARTLQGAAWLTFLDNKGGSRFSDLADAWPGWLYGQDEPGPLAREQLRHAYQCWGRTCISRPWTGLRLAGWPPIFRRARGRS